MFVMQGKTQKPGQKDHGDLGRFGGFVNDINNITPVT
jgi:hypothetical protein